MKKPPTIKRMEEEFDKRFCVKGQDAFFDKVISRTATWVRTRQPRPSEIKSFFRSFLERMLEYLRLEKRGISMTQDNEEWSSACGYGQAVQELNAKIEELKGEK
ncbi:hypothetical protein FJY90_06495 [Candidatus Gottesmanbacteria bacterium]|nr:hypothetical protein [Candidatus Gottesmanbacteria bacterium]